MNKIFNAKFIARTAIFGAISIILYLVPFFQIGLPIFPAFLKIHLDEIPTLIAGFAYGPFSALIILIIKTLVKLPLSETLCVGELADFVYSCAFIIPASLIYKKMRHFKGALLSLLVGIVIQCAVASFLTTFMMLDFYIFVMNIPKDSILGMCQAINPSITSLDWPFLLMVALPFNALKDGIVGVATILLYKKLHTLIDKIGAQKN